MGTVSLCFLRNISLDELHLVEPLAAGDSGLRLVVVPESAARSARPRPLDLYTLRVRHLSAIERGVLVLAGVMIAVGVAVLLFPPDFGRTFPAAHTEGWVSFPESTEHISKSQARIYGLLAATTGFILAWLSLRRNED